MKKVFAFIMLLPLLAGCGKNNKSEEGSDNINPSDYGAFLGRSDNDVTDFNKYKYVSCELDEFTDTNIKRLSEKGTNFLAYLNVGSLEEYRDYYDDFVEYTFLDYEDWPDERWIDVSNKSWQAYLINTVAKDFKDRGAYGVYMDNVDVYTIAKENDKNYVSFANGIKNIIKGVANLGLKVMINGGSEFLDDMNDQEDGIFSSIWAYHQEEVFSLITDYENDKFGKQVKDDTEYYQDIAKIMKNKGKEVFFLEYTKDNTLINEIKSYCESKKYHYYIASKVNLE